MPRRFFCSIRSKKYLLFEENRFLCRRTVFFHTLLLLKRQKGRTGMRRTERLAVLGGDARQHSMIRALSERGYEIYAWGIGDCQKQIEPAVLCGAWEDAVRDADAVILPLPASADGVRVHCPLHERDEMLRMTTLLDRIKGKRLYGGRLSEPIRSLAEQKCVTWFDYYDSELLQLKNAVPTAEGAIAIAMRELPVTLYGIRAAVIGYGRIGCLLSERLHALGAHVTVYARRSEQLTLAELHGHTSVRLRGGNDCFAGRVPDCRVLFNTVPHRLLTEENLSRFSARCVLIDLASAPGGIDHRAAASLGLTSVWATALPGKCAPESAGIILADTLQDLFEQSEHSI